MQEESGPSWRIRGLKKWLQTEPETRDELLKLVYDSRKYLEPDTVTMLEGVLDLPATKIREIMTTRTSMVSLNEDQILTDVLPLLIDSAHSRFPVFSVTTPEAVVGVLLVKDILPVLVEQRSASIEIGALMRAPLFVPESARSDQVLRLLKASQNHIAIVIDEYGSTSGLVTLEDILEEIVGEIEDEYDQHDLADQYILPHATIPQCWLVQALTPIENFNHVMQTDFSDDDVDTVGGLVLQALGLVHDLEDKDVQIGNWSFKILEAEARSIKLLQVTQQQQDQDAVS